MWFTKLASRYYIGNGQYPIRSQQPIFEFYLSYFKIDYQFYGFMGIFRDNCEMFIPSSLTEIIEFHQKKNVCCCMMYLFPCSLFNSPPYFEPLPTSSIISGMLLANIAYKNAVCTSSIILLLFSTLIYGYYSIKV